MVIMTGRLIFTESEKLCLQELVVKHGINSVASCGLDYASISKKRLAWARLTKEFNSSGTNHQRTEPQLKKCWDNMKTRRKRTLREKAERILKHYAKPQPRPSERDEHDSAANDAPIDPLSADAELQFEIDSHLLTPNIQTMEKGVIVKIETSEAEAPNVQEEIVVSQPETDRETRSNVIREELENEIRKENHVRSKKREDEIHELRKQEAVLRKQEAEWAVRTAEEKFKKALIERELAEYLLDQAKKN